MTSCQAEVTSLERSVLGDLDAASDRLVAKASDLVRFRTPNPPGGNETVAQAWMERELHGLGFTVDRWEVLPGRPNVVGVLHGAGGGRSLVLNGHIDVCEERLLDQWATDPYRPVLKNGLLFGRGTTDMKGGLASFLVALEAIQERGIQLAGDVIFQSVVGEETGEAGTRSAISRGYRGDFAIVAEPTRGRALVACVGVLTCRIVIQAEETLHLVAKRLLSANGESLEGANCVEEMALTVVPALEELGRRWAVTKSHPLVPRGSALVNVFRVEGGENPFLLPDQCTAYVSVCYLPDEDVSDVMREVESHVLEASSRHSWLRKHPPRVEWRPRDFPIEFAPSDLDAQSEPIMLLSDAIRVASEREPELGGRGGITDAGWFYQKGIPAVVFGPGNSQVAHAVNEYVQVEDLVSHCKATALFAMRYCGIADAELSADSEKGTASTSPEEASPFG